LARTSHVCDLSDGVNGHSLIAVVESELCHPLLKIISLLVIVRGIAAQRKLRPDVQRGREKVAIYVGDTWKIFEFHDHGSITTTRTIAD